MFDTNAKVPVYTTTQNGRDIAFLVTVSASDGQQCRLMPADLDSIARAKRILNTTDDVLIPFSYRPSAYQLRLVIDSVLAKVTTIPVFVFVSGWIEGAELTMNEFAQHWDISLLKEK